MKKILTLILFLVSCYSYGQQDSINQEYPDTGKTHKVIDMPQFPGGEAGVLQFLKENIKYPDDAKWNEIEGTVRISFYVDTLGNISDIKVLKSIYPSLDSEAVKAVRMMPQWKPGTINGKKARTLYTLPVGFSLRDGTTTDFLEGVNYFKDGKYEKAIKYFTKSIKADKKLLDSYHNRGLCYHQMGNDEEACKDWNEAKKYGDKKIDAALEKYCK
jgi:TonB family protein